MSWDMIQDTFAPGEGVRMVMFEGVEEVEVGRSLLVESNKLDCIVESTMTGRVQGMSVRLADLVEVEEVALEVGNSKLDCIVDNTTSGKGPGMTEPVGLEEVVKAVA